MPMGVSAAHAVIVLAAGASRRLGTPKQLLMHYGETLAHRATRLALTTQPIHAVVVVGAHAARVAAQVQDLGVSVAHCANWKRGLGASLRTGLDALKPGCAAAMIVLCDQPALDAAHLCALRDRWRLDPERAVASAYAGKLGVPALLPRSWFAAARDIRADHGASALLAARRLQVIAIANQALSYDIDHPADTERLHHAT